MKVHIKLHENSSFGSRTVTCGQTGRRTYDGRTDGHSDANTRFFLLYERACKQ